MTGAPPRTVVVGLSGGIACYKACDLVRLLAREGLRVRVVMTRGATRFVTPLTLQALSNQPVGTDVFDLTQESEIGHIRLADEADAVVVAPATADVLAKMAHGIADDLLTTVLLATRAPLLVAPAMNVHMWEHAATQANVRALRERGVGIVEPGVGSLACGYEGPGRLAEPAEIVERVLGLLTPADLAGERVLVSAGPTQEPLDPVRYVSNRSSGKMGYAVARMARRRGATVTLVTGPCETPPPPGVRVVPATTAADMAEALRREFQHASVLVMAAAVADYRPVRPTDRKIKKRERTLSIPLARTEDIVTGLARRKGRRLVVGFAAETHDLVGAAREKLRAKRLDLVVANDVTQPGAGFGSDTNLVRLLGADGTDEQLELLPKEVVANRILDWVASRRQSGGGRRARPAGRASTRRRRPGRPARR